MTAFPRRDGGHDLQPQSGGHDRLPGPGRPGSAAIIPSLVVLTAHHYKGPQQATALGVLAAVQAIATVVAFFVAGVVGTYFGWRYSFGLLIPFSLGVLLLSRYLEPVAPCPASRSTAWGVVLAAAAVILVSLGFNYLDDWGVLT